MSRTDLAPQLCVGAVVRRQEALLLIKRGTAPGKGFWSLPGGRVEPGESMAEAVVREVNEETGLTVHCGPLVGWVEHLGPDHHFAIFDFAAELTDPTQRPVAGDDADAAGFFCQEEVEDLRLVAGLRTFLHDHGILPLPA